jgi:hypothetical protein
MLCRQVWSIHFHRSSENVLASTNSLWMGGYLLADPGSENLSQDFSGDETNAFVPHRLKSASGRAILKTSQPARFQSLCLFGSSCESYNQHAIMEAEHTDPAKVDDGMPKDLDAATQKEIHDAIDVELNEQDMDHTIKEGSPTNAFRSRPAYSTIALSPSPQTRLRRFFSSMSSGSNQRWLRTNARIMNSIRALSESAPLTGHGASFQVRRAARAFRQYEAVAAAAAAADDAAAGINTQATEAVVDNVQRRPVGEAVALIQQGPSTRPAAPVQTLTYPPLPAY